MTIKPETVELLLKLEIEFTGFASIWGDHFNSKCIKQFGFSLFNSTVDSTNR